MTRRITSTTLMLAALALTAIAQEGKPADPPKEAAVALPMCPVMEELADLSIFVESDQGPVFLCCAECKDKYSSDPAKYAANLEKQRDLLEKMPKTQVRCPVSGKAVSKDAFIEDAGKKISFCCKACPEGYKKEPAKFSKKLANAYTYQTRCPVSGEPIDPAVFLDLKTKQRIYFSDKECVTKFNSEPAKYVEKLAKMGVHVDAEKVGKK